ncbi:MAG: 4Fe-4S dicluster domain-containing protein [Coriobacteriia bacterium]|nr:4Fe-4S dicluster domain-containing protein [Coriobacteriia bacterium]MCL2746005.1 4Fe-4S dicluster domain-containing protein [Coriobacteriia bacterium]MCL2870708.1 4Fe-4S dicluster domain-containing protein [Coriobacteriia bacterium]
MASSIAILFDASKCTGCKGCQVACKSWNQLPAPLDFGDAPFSGTYESPMENTGDTWLRITFDEIEVDENRVTLSFGRDACKHCSDAPCVSVCSSGACHRAHNGTIVLDESKCFGCQYCVAACPFKVPKFSDRDNKAKKCSFCQDRLQNGLTPACRKSCPVGALDFGARKDMMAKAQRRALELMPDFPNVEVYGVTQMDGMGVISILPFGAAEHRETVNPQAPLMTRIENALPAIAGVGVLGALGVTAAAFIGGRGSGYTEEQYTYDKVRRVTCDGGKPMDPDAPIVKVGLKTENKVNAKGAEAKEGEVKSND